MSVFDILVIYHEGLLAGLAVTFKLALLIWTIGIIGGCALGAAAARWQSAVGWPMQVLSFILSGVPILVLLFWMHYPLQEMINVVIDPFITALAALSLVNVFLVAELIRRVLVDFPKQYLIAAQVCGLTPLDTLLSIQLPIVFRQSIPGVLMIQVNLLQATLFASLISVDEIFRVAQHINAQIYKPVEIYTALAILFLLVCLPLNGLALWLRQRFTRDFSER